MSYSSCPVEQDLCPIVIGDTADFDFLFLNDDGSKKDITGMQIDFIAELIKNQETPDLKVSHTFPADENSENGSGYMSLLPAETAVLLARRAYYYKFRLIVVVDVDEYTIGAGTFEAKL